MQEEIQRLPCKVVRTANGDVAVEVEVDGRPKEFSPPEISAIQAGVLKGEVKEALKGSHTAAIKAASEKLNETWQAVSAELYQAASEKTRGGQGPAGGQSGTPSEAGGAAEGDRKAEGPIIDAEVVDDQKVA